MYVNVHVVILMFKYSTVFKSCTYYSLINNAINVNNNYL